MTTLFFWVLSICLPVITALPYTFPICGNVTYDPTMYCCAPGSTIMCPIINGQDYQLCNTACYDTHMYTCLNGTLRVSPQTNGPFSLTASNPTARFDGLTLQASDYSFFLGLDRPATYCPSPPVPAGSCPSGRQTVLYTGSLGAIVPGGQRTYITTSGALSYTVPHSGAMPNLYSQEVRSYDGLYGGGYFGPGGVGWVACPSEDINVWQVFARIPDVVFAADCFGLDLVVNNLATGTVGAWEYI